MKKIDEKEAFRQAFAYLKKGDARQCINVCKNALIHYPENINLLCLISRASMAVRLFEDAQGFLNEATRLNPKSPIARETYGDLLLVQGKAEEAIREYLFVKELNPGQHEIDRKINHAREVNKKLSMEISEALQKVGDQKKDVVRDSFEEEIKEAIDHQESGRGELAEEIYREYSKARSKSYRSS